MSPEITVGFCQYGPTLTLAGMLSTSKHVILINSIDLSLDVPFRSAKKEFEWFAFQSGSPTEASLGINVEAPSKFVLSPGRPHNYNILFVDNQRYAEMKNILLSVSFSWQTFLETHKGQDHKKAFEAFTKETVVKGMRELLEQGCYWKTGTYIVRVNITAKNENFVTEKNFQLTQKEHIAAFKNNSTSILAALCGQPSVLFQTATVPLE